jgi:hypothetical protein
MEPIFRPGFAKADSNDPARSTHPPMTPIEGGCDLPDVRRKNSQKARHSLK